LFRLDLHFQRGDFKPYKVHSRTPKITGYKHGSCGFKGVFRYRNISDTVRVQDSE
jgi:hypothetical protein